MASSVRMNQLLGVCDSFWWNQFRHGLGQPCVFGPEGLGTLVAGKSTSLRSKLGRFRVSTGTGIGTRRMY